MASLVTENVAFCRICRLDDSAGRLISPCRCRGSIKHVHLECIKRWRNFQISMSLNQNPNAGNFCEICRSIYRFPTRWCKIIIEEIIVNFFMMTTLKFPCSIIIYIVTHTFNKDEVDYFDVLLTNGLVTVIILCCFVSKFINFFWGYELSKIRVYAYVCMAFVILCGLKIVMYVYFKECAILFSNCLEYVFVKTFMIGLLMIVGFLIFLIEICELMSGRVFFIT